MSRLALLSIFLLSCAGPTPSRTYADGVPMAPRAPAFDPVWESPTDTGHPGHVAAPLPRSPYSRELPQTPETRREDGLWSAEEPQATRSPIRLTPPRLLNVELPLPPLHLTDEDKEPAYECAASLENALNQTRLFAPAYFLDEHARKCLVARLYLYCLAVVERDSTGKRHVDRVARLKTTAAHFVQLSCDGAAQSRGAARIYAEVEAAIDAAHEANR